MGALSDEAVGAYVNRHFVSAFQKVATFRIDAGAKQGGNVAAYFCTPEGRVLHAIAGPVTANVFLREARWANETYQFVQISRPAPEELQAAFRKAHLERLELEHFVSLNANRLPDAEAFDSRQLKELLARNGHLNLANPGKVHLVLGVTALPRLDRVYHVVFEAILNERISTRPVRVAGE